MTTTAPPPSAAGASHPRPAHSEVPGDPLSLDPEALTENATGDVVAVGVPDAAPLKRRRLDHIDAMRPVKQAGVVSTHTILAFAPLASIAAGGSLMLLHVTREAFLFVSACMLTYSYRELRSDALPHFYRRRFVSVGLPYLCWTLIYFFLTLHGASYTPWTGFVHLAYLTGSGYYQLYYLIVIMQFYVVFPLLLHLLRKTRTVRHHVIVLSVSFALQVLMVTLMHWNLVPSAFRGFWATREITSYQFYLVAGMVVALHLNDFQDWLCRHARAVVACTVAAAVLAEGWYVLAVHHAISWLGSGNDPFQPVVIPFNIGAIACIYLFGMYLVADGRSRRTRVITRSGSDNAYGIYLAQMLFILPLTWLGWKRIVHAVPWPLVAVGTMAFVVLACVLLTSIAARTPLAVAVTGRKQQSWASWLPEEWRHGRDRRAGIGSAKTIRTTVTKSASGADSDPDSDPAGDPDHSSTDHRRPAPGAAPGSMPTAASAATAQPVGATTAP